MAKQAFALLPIFFPRARLREKIRLLFPNQVVVAKHVLGACRFNPPNVAKKVVTNTQADRGPSQQTVTLSESGR